MSTKKLLTDEQIQKKIESESLISKFSYQHGLFTCDVELTAIPGGELYSPGLVHEKPLTKIKSELDECMKLFMDEIRKDLEKKSKTL